MINFIMCRFPFFYSPPKMDTSMTTGKMMPSFGFFKCTKPSISLSFLYFIQCVSELFSFFYTMYPEFFFFFFFCRYLICNKERKKNAPMISRSKLLFFKKNLSLVRITLQCSTFYFSQKVICSHN